MDVQAEQRWADEFLDERAAPPSPLTLETLGVRGPGTGFSPFVVEDAEAARECSCEPMRAADDAGGGPANCECGWPYNLLRIRWLNPTFPN
jgi:hypothetical protein